MVARVKLELVQPRSYFAAAKDIPFCSSGCTVLDCALGGGWALNRVINVVGDRSAGKTLLAIEASTNFLRQYPKGSVRYRERELAFDEDYAAALGMPISKVDFKNDIGTIEDFQRDIIDTIKKAPKPCFYVLDSLDSLSDEEERKREVGKGSYGMAKAKALSEIFRRHNADLTKSGVTTFVISQTRDKLDAVAFGKKWTRAGGKALDFYASQIVYLAQVEKITRTVNGVKRKTGVVINAKLEKNKVSLPFREARFDIVFGYGIDDNKACLEFLRTSNVPIPGDLQPAAALKAMQEGDAKYTQLVRDAVVNRWYEIEQSFLPTRGKYA